MAKDELLKQVWPDTFVEENNLTQNIFLLRRVLGDERPAPKYIETVVRRGYRFVANVRVVGDGDVRERGSVNSAVSSQGSNGDDASALRSVAVLPFVNATGNQDVEYLADGLTENIVNNLARSEAASDVAECGVSVQGKERAGSADRWSRAWCWSSAGGKTYRSGTGCRR